MRCWLYSDNGRLMGDGLCGVRRDGTIEMITLMASSTLTPDDWPLQLVEGPRQYAVAMMSRHAPRDPHLRAVATVYHLVPCGSDRDG